MKTCVETFDYFLVDSTTKGVLYGRRKLTRSLSARHIQMIALGGTIGVGLFMGASSTIRWTGPSVMGAYAIAGFFCI